MKVTPCPGTRTCHISSGTCLGPGCVRKNKGVEVPGEGWDSVSSAPLGSSDAFSPPGRCLHPQVGCFIKKLQQAAQECLRDSSKVRRSGTLQVLEKPDVNRNSCCSVSCLLPSPSQGPGSDTGTCPNTPPTTAARDEHLQLHFVLPKHAPKSCGWHQGWRVSSCLASAGMWHLGFLNVCCLFLLFL